MVKIIDKENPNANVAILCPYIFFVNAFGGILKHLPNAEIVPDFTGAPAGKLYPETYKENFRKFLLEKKLPWRDFENSNLTITEFFSKYGTIVSPYHGGFAKNVALERHKKVRVFYGAAKDLWMFSLSSVFFDHICTPGKYFTNTLLGLYENYGLGVSSTGEPKLDDLHSVGKEEARKLLCIESPKPILLVASTWGSLSSLKKIAALLTRFTDQYEVIVKIHHVTQVFEPEILDVFRNTTLKIIDESTPVSHALAAADVVLSDGSGIIFDTVLAEKPIVILDTIGEMQESFFIETPFYGRKGGILTGAPTSSRSLEQIIKQKDFRIGPVVPAYNGSLDYATLRSAIEGALSNGDLYREVRELIKSDYFSPIDGKASERVASEIMRISEVSARDMRSKRDEFFPLLVRDFEKRITEGTRAYRDTKVEMAQELLNRMTRIRNLPYLARLTEVINEFF